jgi:hypothetical protein
MKQFSDDVITMLAISMGVPYETSNSFDSKRGVSTTTFTLLEPVDLVFKDGMLVLFRGRTTK